MMIESKNKIPVCETISELRHTISQYEHKKFCLYLAYKDLEGWEKSTSRVYMNQVSPTLVYLPINIKKEDYASLRGLYQYANENPDVIAINQTQPHKSNPVLREFFKDTNIPINIDTLIKDRENKLRPYDLNGPSFVEWFKDEVSRFDGKSVVVLGVGGVGEPIARRIMQEGPKQMILVDVIPKEHLAHDLSKSGDVKYYKHLKDLTLPPGNIVFLNCAGKEGTSEETGADVFLTKYSLANNVFVDLRPQLEIDLVVYAKIEGWKAYTGHGMNARNDYTLLTKIAEVTGIKIPNFETFRKMVADAS
jgi:shikimate 5-dehydrogenase